MNFAKELNSVGEANSQMSALNRNYRSWMVVLLFVASAGLSTPARAAAQASPSQFTSPDDALQALVSAATTKDRTALAKVFGSDYDKLLSGDQAEDDKDLNDFSQAVQESAKLLKDSDSKYTVVVGKDNWPTPIPIVQKNGKWEFDTDAGLDEVINRRVGVAPMRSRSGSTSPKAIGITTASPNMPSTSPAHRANTTDCSGKRPKKTLQARWAAWSPLPAPKGSVLKNKPQMRPGRAARKTKVPPGIASHTTATT
jgi:hypothetical protein